MTSDRRPTLGTAVLVTALCAGAIGGLHCSSDTSEANPVGDSGIATDTAPQSDTAPPGEGGPPGSDGPPSVPNPNVHAKGDATKGKNVFRMETFGNEGFWTDAAQLPQGALAAKFTPVMALKAGLQVDIDALDDATKTAVAAELKTDLSPAKAPKLNDVATTVALLNAQAVIGLVVVDTNKDGKTDLATGDKLGVSCAFCHTISDKSVFDLPGGGSIGKRIDGPTPHTLNVGASFALAANTRALFPIAQVQIAGGTQGRAPTGLTEDSTEADIDAYFSNPDFYPVGSFDDTPDGNGNPVHITPLFRTDLAAPWGSAGEVQFLDDFSNNVYTLLLDPTNLTSTGGKAFVHAVAGAAGDELLTKYAKVLAATGVTGGPFVVTATTGTPGDEKNSAGVRVDNTTLLDMNAYLDSLAAPKGDATVDAASVARGRAVFRSTGTCTSCHNVDQSKFVPPNVIDMSTIWPGYAPVVLLPRDPPKDPIQNSPGTFDDKMIVIDASLRGLKRGTALPLLLDLARKPVFLHDSSVTSLDKLLDPARGPSSPHPVYIADAAQRADVVAFLKSLDTTTK
ncbi:MAG: hypothetical protein NVS3B10_11620 [Polyangiales bacterium]